MATGEDFRWASTEGGRPDALTRLAHRYLEGIVQLATCSPRASRAFMEVWHLVAPPAILAQPASAGWARMAGTSHKSHATTDTSANRQLRPRGFYGANRPQVFPANRAAGRVAAVQSPKAGLHLADGYTERAMLIRVLISLRPVPGNRTMDL